MTVTPESLRALVIRELKAMPTALTHDPDKQVLVIELDPKTVIYSIDELTDRLRPYMDEAFEIRFEGEEA